LHRGTEANKKKQPLRKRKEDYASNLFADQTPNAQDIKAPQAAKVHDLQSDALEKEIASMPPPSLLRRFREMFPPGGHQPKQEAS
jgi:hypothetical protein